MMKMAMAAALVLAFSGGAALAQQAQDDNFYADPVMADPPVKPVHVFPASVATEVVAAVSPAADLVPLSGAAQPAKAKAPVRAAACRPVSHCAVKTPGARG